MQSQLRSIDRAAVLTRDNPRGASAPRPRLRATLPIHLMLLRYLLTAVSCACVAISLNCALSRVSMNARLCNKTLIKIVLLLALSLIASPSDNNINCCKSMAQCVEL